MSSEARSFNGGSDPAAIPGPTDWADLRAFVEVARHSSFSRAGLRLLLSQSTVSRQVARLERRFGIVLFERTSRRVRLTPEGELLLSQLADVVYSVEQVLMAGAPHAGRATIRVITCHVPQDLVLDGVASHTGDAWELSTGTVEQGLRAVVDGSAAHAVTLWFPQVRPLPVDRVMCRSASTVGLRLALPRDAVDGVLPAVRLHEFHDARWALPADDDLESAFRLACLTAGFVPDIRLRAPIGSDPALGMRQGLIAVLDPWAHAPDGGRVVSSPDLPTTTLLVTSRLGTDGLLADTLADLIGTFRRAA
ncbi:LysR family transcriptional regulator [Actinokineospora guangxiensis]|uniref:LysR family transcriptional regulator n=1 Tax=Actinokineospora guangxiensis TaxID=1490288 RepID=A0ABW0ETA4_9PSEU